MRYNPRHPHCALASRRSNERTAPFCGFKLERPHRTTQLSVLNSSDNPGRQGESPYICRYILVVPNANREFIFLDPILFLIPTYKMVGISPIFWGNSLEHEAASDFISC